MEALLLLATNDLREKVFTCTAMHAHVAILVLNLSI